VSNHPVLGHIGDIGATVATALIAVSHWAEILNPILSGAAIVATLVWWFLRFRQWWTTGE